MVIETFPKNRKEIDDRVLTLLGGLKTKILCSTRTYSKGFPVHCLPTWSTWVCKLLTTSGGTWSPRISNRLIDCDPGMDSYATSSTPSWTFWIWAFCGISRVLCACRMASFVNIAPSLVPCGIACAALWMATNTAHAPKTVMHPNDFMVTIVNR